MTTTLIPLQASFQAHRYQRLGHGDLFSRLELSHNSLASGACTNVSGQGQERLDDQELPAGWQRDDAERILNQMARQFHQGILLLVSPTPEQLTQLQADGLLLHPARLELLLAALDHSIASAKQFARPGYSDSLIALAHQLRLGALVVIKTT